MALKQLKNNKAPGDDGITKELLRGGGQILLVLQNFFNSVILEGTTLESWQRSVVVLFFKKGDSTLFENYRPITLLSHVYELFLRVITNHLECRLDDFQPPKQAGFWIGFCFGVCIETPPCSSDSRKTAQNQSNCREA